MIELTPHEVAALKSWYRPNRPGVLLGPHVVKTGLGKLFVDRWPNPRAVLAATTDNYSLSGDPQVLTPADLLVRISGFLDAPQSFLPLLQESFPEIEIWERIIFAQEDHPWPPPITNVSPRKLAAEDIDLLIALSDENSWIHKTWQGPAGLAGSGYAWAAIDGHRILSLACSFFVGETYEEIGVATEPDYLGQGLSSACAYALCADIIARGSRASWSTSTDNQASIRVAEKLGFQFLRYDHLYAVNQEIPDVGA